MYRRELGAYTNKKSIDLQMLRSNEETEINLKELLEYCKEKQLKIAFQNKTVEPEWMMEVYQIIIDRTRAELKAKQQAGIRLALKRREEGKGTYGRPRTELPPDFEKQLKRRIKEKENLSRYCDQIKMKKSTFYKWAKIYIASWEEEEELIKN